MIKKLIKKVNQRYLDSTTEEIYIDRISSLAKECWKFNMNQEGIFIEVAKFVNKLKLSEERHPFLVTFRDDINIFLRKDCFDNKEASKLLNSLYEYRDRTLKSKVKDVE